MPPAIPDREIGIEDIVSSTMKLYRGRFTLFFGAFLAASLPGTILAAVTLAPFLEYLNSYVSSQTLSYPSTPPFDYSMIPIIILVAILSGLLLLFATGFSIVASSTLMKGGEVDVATLLRETYNRFWRLLGTMILTGIGLMIVFFVPFVFMFAFGDSGIIIGILLFIVAFVGIFYLSFRLALFPTIVYLEDVGMVDSLRRSYDLLKGRVLNTFVLMLALGLISAIPTVVADQITGFLGTNLWYVSAVITFVATALGAPIEAIALTVYYYSMKAREAPPPVPSPPIILTPG